MERKLTKKEIELLKKGIDNRSDRLTKLKEDYDYNNEAFAFQEKFKDYIKRKRADEEKRDKELAKKMLENLKEKIKMEEEAFNKEIEMLNKGTVKEKEIKVPLGVN